MRVPRRSTGASAMVNSPWPSETQRQPVGLAGLAALDLDPVGHHEGGVEADAELADQRHVLGGVACHLLHEGGGAGARDGAEVLHEVVVVHADAVVGDGEGAGLAVGRQGDPVAAVVARQFRLGQRQVAQPVAGVRRIRDQLAQEHRLVAVERVGDDLQQAADLRLKAMAFFRHLVSHPSRLLHPAADMSNKPVPIKAGDGFPARCGSATTRNSVSMRATHPHPHPLPLRGRGWG